jgi:hypothetical protein
LPPENHLPHIAAQSSIVAARLILQIQSDLRSMDGPNSPDSQFHSQSDFSKSNLEERLTSQRSAIHLIASDRIGSNFDRPQEGLTLFQILCHQTQSLSSKDGRDAVSGFARNQLLPRFLSCIAIDQTQNRNLNPKVRVERDRNGHRGEERRALEVAERKHRVEREGDSNETDESDRHDSKQEGP